jgi:hypothetical protein
LFEFKVNTRGNVQEASFLTAETLNLKIFEQVGFGAMNG